MIPIPNSPGGPSGPANPGGPCGLEMKFISKK